MTAPAILQSLGPCVGVVVSSQHSLNVTCEVSCNSHGEVMARFDAIAITRESEWLLVAAHAHGTRLRLSVRHEDAGLITSDEVLFTSIRTSHSEEGSLLSLVAHLTRMRMQLPHSTDDIDLSAGSTVIFWTVGMMGFGNIARSFEDIEVRIGGPSELTDFNSLAGHIAFRQFNPIPDLQEWKRNCQRRAVSILGVLSLALGKLVDWSVEDVFVGNVLVERVFVGPRSSPPPVEGAMHFLHLEPAFELALRSQAAIADPSTGIREAINWIVPWYTFAEIRFLSAFSALECLLARNDNSPSHIVESKLFRSSVSKALRAALLDSQLRVDLETEGGHSEEVHAALEEITTRIGNLNQRSLTSRLVSFLGRLDVPLDDLPVSIAELVRARNSVVHGRSPTGRDGEESVTVYARVLREALRRTILAILGFDGYFNSYLSGAPEWRPFRSAPPAT